MRALQQLLLCLFRCLKLQLRQSSRIPRRWINKPRIFARCEPHHKDERSGECRLHVAQVRVRVLAEDKQNAQAQHGQVEQGRHDKARVFAAGAYHATAAGFAPLGTLYFLALL